MIKAGTETGDMRVSVICPNYRYSKISQLLEVGQFYRYVGVICTFERANLLKLKSKSIGSY
jgi:hypothetical protein